MPEPALPAYLSVPDCAKPGQRGGTLIREDVWSFPRHEELLEAPDGYRPEACAHCGESLHGHGTRWRLLRDQPERREIRIRRYRCPACRAMWQVLPALLARWLHRTWAAVQSRMVQAGVLARAGPEWRVPRKATTTRRHALRLRASARRLTQILAAAGVELGEVLEGGLWTVSRAELAEALAAAGLVSRVHELGELAVWIHRLVPGVRLM